METWENHVFLHKNADDAESKHRNTEGSNDKIYKTQETPMLSHYLTEKKL